MIERCHPAGQRSVTGRVATILREVAARPDRSMTEVARRTELPVSTTHRLLGELVAARLVQRGPGGRYRIGPAGGPVPATALTGVPTAATALEGVPGVDRVAAVRTHVAAALDDLAAITGLRARFGVWHERGVSFLDRAGGRGPRVRVPGLDVVPVHATALGRALLAYKPPSEVRRVLARGLPAYTDGTVTTPDALAAALAVARARGVAVVRREWRADESAVAVPVFGPGGAVAALELTAGAFPLAAAVPALVVAARALGRRLAEDPVALPSGTGPAPLRWPVDPTAPALSLVDAAGSTA
jgi:IclR family transcriptional regulator, acetate operon repressor